MERPGARSRRELLVAGARSLAAYIVGNLAWDHRPVMGDGPTAIGGSERAVIGAKAMFLVVDDSSKCDSRLYEPRNQEPDGVLVHTSSGVDSQGWLQGGSIHAGSPASADFLITRSDKIIRLVPRGNMSYHAGVTQWNGVIESSNNASRALVGVELENADGAGQVPTQRQHAELAALLLAFAAHYPTLPLEVYGHYGIAWPEGRRSDPHGLNWGFVFWLMAHAQDSLTLYGVNPF